MSDATRYPTNIPLCCHEGCDAPADWWHEVREACPGEDEISIFFATPYCNTHCPVAPLKDIE